MASSPISSRCSAIAARCLSGARQPRRGGRVFFGITQIAAPGRPDLRCCSSALMRWPRRARCAAHVLVENGQKFSSSGAFVNQQWLWFNIAADAGLRIVRRPAGAACCRPHGALHAAALDRRRSRRWRCCRHAAAGPREERAGIDPAGVAARPCGRSLAAFQHAGAVVDRGCSFSAIISAPASSTPLYFYMTDSFMSLRNPIHACGRASLPRPGRAMSSSFLDRGII